MLSKSLEDYTIIMYFLLIMLQIEHRKGQFKKGSVILSNHPMAGGSHLPDLTVITPVFIE